MQGALHFHLLSHWPIQRPQAITLPLISFATWSRVGFEATSFASKGSFRAMMSKKSVESPEGPILSVKFTSRLISSL